MVVLCLWGLCIGPWLKTININTSAPNKHRVFWACPTLINKVITVIFVFKDGGFKYEVQL